MRLWQSISFWIVPAVLAGCASTAAPAAESTSKTAAPTGAMASSPADSGSPLPEATPARTVLAGHVENARDLGGVALGAAGQVGSRLLFRGPPLANLTEEGCAAVTELGIRSVIDLRVESEVSLKPDDPCALNNAQLLAAPLPVPYNVSAADYIAVLDANDSIVRVFELLGDEAHYPVYFHCTWGRDRTGIMAAVILLALGATPDAIMEDYLVSDETVGAFPASLEAALEEVAARGGIDAYLAAAGVKAEQVANLRAHVQTDSVAK